MTHLIIGTAGHVDHGKTQLIRALTGMDTDRLAEEKKRGITIELGFAWLDLGDGRRAGIVDVPGHERFIKNMLAGAGGIDLVLFVVAADEGVMPQTVEHLDILTLLGVRDGVVVVTKCDLVDDDWLALVDEDIKTLLAPTFLRNAPLLHTSAVTGDGIEALRRVIAERIARTPEKATKGPFRLPIDRVFSIGGFGTVVTGTLIEGHIAKGQSATLYPERKTFRVRTVEVHGVDADEATAGQRVAVNLSGDKIDTVSRGSVLATSDSLLVSDLIDVRLTALASAGFTIKTQSRVHLHHGTSETVAKVWLIGRDELKGGESGWAQLSLETPLAVKARDRFIIRFYSPLQTIGGGVVIDPAPLKHKRHDEAIEATLTALSQDDDDTILLAAIDSQSHLFLTFDHIRLRTALTEDEAKRALQRLSARGHVVSLPGSHPISAAYLARFGAKASETLLAFHAEHPLTAGMRRDSLRTTLLPRTPIAITDKLIDHLIARGVVRDNDGLIADGSFAVTLDANDEALIAAIEARYKDGGYQPPTISEVLAQTDLKRGQEVIANLLRDKTLIRLDKDLLLHHTVFEDAKERVLAAIANGGALTLAAFRDDVNTSRKFAVAILETFDRNRITRLVDGVRVAYTR